MSNSEVTRWGPMAAVVQPGSSPGDFTRTGGELAPTYSTGDVVKLKSGGLPMTVSESTTDGTGKVLCYWHTDKGEPQSGWFLPATLTQVVF